MTHQLLDVMLARLTL